MFSSKFKIHKKYDLKGSTVDRQASTKEKVTVLAMFCILISMITTSKLSSSC